MPVRASVRRDRLLLRLGGTAGLDTMGGSIERMALAGDPVIYLAVRAALAGRASGDPAPALAWPHAVR